MSRIAVLFPILTQVFNIIRSRFASLTRGGGFFATDMPLPEIILIIFAVERAPHAAPLYGGRDRTRPYEIPNSTLLIPNS